MSCTDADPTCGFVLFSVRGNVETAVTELRVCVDFGCYESAEGNLMHDELTEEQCDDCCVKTRHVVVML